MLVRLLLLLLYVHIFLYACRRRIHTFGDESMSKNCSLNRSPKSDTTRNTHTEKKWARMKSQTKMPFARAHIQRHTHTRRVEVAHNVQKLSTHTRQVITPIVFFVVSIVRLVFVCEYLYTLTIFRVCNFFCPHPTWMSWTLEFGYNNFNNETMTTANGIFF